MSLKSELHLNKAYDLIPRIFIFLLFLIECFNVSFEGSSGNLNLFKVLFNARNFVQLLIFLRLISLVDDFAEVGHILC
jgi:hypothetical protein